MRARRQTELTSPWPPTLKSIPLQNGGLPTFLRSAIQKDLFQTLPMAKLKIIRVILHSDRRKMDRATLKGKGFWKHLHLSYGERLIEYEARVFNLIAACAREAPDLVLFPACTAIWRYHAQLERYRREMSQFPYVAFGCLRLDQPRFKEHSEIWARGRRLMHFDARWPIAVKLAGRSAVVAQSSTIKVVYQFPPLILPADRSPANQPYKLALDLGHGQYQGRYRRVFRKLKSLGMDAVLSFWRNRHGQTRYPWLETVGRYQMERRELPTGDYLDVLR